MNDGGAGCNTLAMRFVLLLAVLAGCSGYGPEDNPTQLVDSTGLVFDWACDDEGCDITDTPELSFRPPCAAPGWGVIFGQFYELCTVCYEETVGELPWWEDGAPGCRPIACETADDCPLIYEYDDGYVYECVEGLCQNVDVGAHPRAPLTRDAASTLCFAEVDRASTRAYDAPAVTEVRAMIDAACGGPRAPYDAPCDSTPACAVR